MHITYGYQDLDVDRLHTVYTARTAAYTVHTVQYIQYLLEKRSSGEKRTQEEDITHPGFKLPVSSHLSSYRYVVTHKHTLSSPV